MTLAETIYRGLIFEYRLTANCSDRELMRALTDRFNQDPGRWFGKKNRRYRHAMIRSMLHWHHERNSKE